MLTCVSKEKDIFLLQEEKKSGLDRPLPTPPPPKRKVPCQQDRGNLSPWDFHCGKEVTFGKEREVREIETAQ